MSKKWELIGLIIVAFTILYNIVGVLMSKVEQPKYEVILSQGDIEIRNYNQMTTAEVAIDGKRKEAIKSGFKILAGYIFGDNKLREDIAMTAPVRQQSNKKISMTTPVRQRKVCGRWKISFILPSQYSISTIPIPNHKDISIEKIDSKKYAVIKFSGINSDQNIHFYESKIKNYLLENRIQTVSSPIYAFYNPPWTMPFLRRNEIMIEVNLVPL